MARTAPLLALVMLACSPIPEWTLAEDAGIPFVPSDSSVPMDAGVSDAGIGDANADANADAGPRGDPTLDRDPNTACYTPYSNASSPWFARGYAVDVYPGALANGNPAARLTSDTSYCSESNLLQFRLGYEAPATTRATGPSIRLARPLAAPFAIDYVLETVVSNDTDDILAGMYLLSGNDLATYRALSVTRNAQGNFSMARVTANGTTPTPFGALVPPIHFHVEVTTDGAGAATNMHWKATAQDRNRTVELRGDDTIPTPTFDVSLGENRVSPGALNVVTFSHVSLP